MISKFPEAYNWLTKVNMSKIRIRKSLIIDAITSKERLEIIHSKIIFRN